MATYPGVIPVFPLTGILLLHGGSVPLHIFEARYRSMIQDALEGESVIGMIQPLLPQSESPRDDGAETDPPDLYSVGCAGAIERWERLEDGRYLILVRGVSRFRIDHELPEVRGYRRFQVGYAEFAADADVTQELDTTALLQTLQAFSDAHQMALDLGRLRELPGITLLNSVAMALPFAPAEKQALLEAPTLVERYDTLVALLRMGVELKAYGESYAPQPLN